MCGLGGEASPKVQKGEKPPHAAFVAAQGDQLSEVLRPRTATTFLLFAASILIFSLSFCWSFTEASLVIAFAILVPYLSVVFLGRPLVLPKRRHLASQSLAVALQTLLLSTLLELHRSRTPVELGAGTTQ